MNPQADSHGQHISQQFNSELEDLKNHMLEMGGLVERQINDALEAAFSSDSGQGTRVIDSDDEIDAMEVQIDEECLLIIARRQPAASDLRLVLAITKAVRDLERIGDETSKIANLAIQLSETGEPPKGLVELRQVGEHVVRMVNMALDAFARYDVESALKVVVEDAKVDQEYGSALRALVTYMMEDARYLGSVLNVMWGLRALERIGDHAKNIAEHVIYLVKGTDVRHEKIKDVAEQIRERE